MDTSHFYPMSINFVTQNHPWQISTFMKNMKDGESFNHEFLIKYTKVWPFERMGIFLWSKVISAIKARILEIKQIYYEGFLQIKPFTETHKCEVLVFLDFLQVLFENCTGRVQLNVYEPLYFIIYNVDYTMSYTALCLLRLVIQKQSRAVLIAGENAKLNNLYEVIILGKMSNYKYKGLSFNFKKCTLLSINQLLNGVEIEEKEYIKILFAYKLFKDTRVINQKHIIASLLIFKKSTDINNNAPLKEIIKVALETVNKAPCNFYKTNIFDMLNIAVERRYRVKIIFDCLRLRIHGGFFIAHFENLHIQDVKYIKSFVAFLTTCILTKNDPLAFCVECGLMEIFKNTLGLKLQDHGLSLVELKISILKCLFLALSNNSNPSSLIIISEDIFDILYAEFDTILSILPITDYEIEIIKGTVFENEKFAVYRRYLKAAIKMIEQFYAFVIPRDNELEVTYMIDTPIMKIFERILLKHECYSYKSIYYILNIVVIYINAYPLNIGILQDNGFLDVLFGIYNEILPFSIIAIVSIDLINCLSLKKEVTEHILEQKLLEKVLKVVISERYLDSLTLNATSSQVGIALEELIRHHPVYQKIVYNECRKSLNELIAMEDLPESLSDKIFLNLLTNNSNPQGIVDIEYNMYNIYQEKVKNVIMVFEALLLIENFEDSEVSAILLLFANIISKKFFYFDGEDDFVDLFMSFFVKNIKVDSTTFLHDRIFDNTFCIIDNIKALNISKCVDLIIEIETLFSNSKTRPGPLQEITETNKILGSNKDEFYTFVFYLQSASRLILLEKEIAFRKIKTKKQVEMTKRIFKVFEEIFDIYKEYLHKKRTIYLRYSEHFDFGIFRDDLVYYNNSLHYFGTKMGVLIYILHFNTLALLRDVWNEITTIKAVHVEHIINALLEVASFTKDYRLKDINPIETFENEKNNPQLQITENSKKPLPTEEYIFEGDVLFLHHITETFFLTNLINILFEIDGLFLISDNIHGIFKNIYLLIDNLKILNENNRELAILPLVDIRIPDKDVVIFTDDKIAKVNIYNMDTIDGIVGIMTKCLKNNIRTIVKMLNQGLFILKTDEKNIILDLAIRIHFMNRNNDITMQIAEIFKWLIPDKYYDLTSYSDYENIETTEDIGVAKCFLDSLLRMQRIEKKNSINSKSFYNYLVKSGGYSILNELQKRKVAGWYAILQHNKYLIDKIKITKEGKVRTAVSDMINVSLLIYIFRNPCTCQDANSILLSSKISSLSLDESHITAINDITGTSNSNIHVKNKIMHCNAHYDDVLLGYLEDTIRFNTSEIPFMETLKTVFVFQRICEHNLIYCKETLFDKFNWKGLFLLLESNHSFNINQHINSIVFYFLEDISFIRKVIKSEMNTTSALTANLSVLNFRNKEAFNEIVETRSFRVTCTQELGRVQVDMFKVLLKYLFITTYPVILLQIICQALVYFPILVSVISKKSFVNKLLSDFILKKLNKTDKKQTQQYNWTVNLISTLLSRTNDNEIKKLLIDFMIRNMKSGNEATKIAILNLLVDVINAKILDDRYRCDAECCKDKPNMALFRPPFNHQSMVSIINAGSNSRAERRRLTQIPGNTTDTSAIDGLLDNITERINNMPANWRTNEREFIVNTDEILNSRTSRDCINVSQSTNTLVIDLLTDRKIMAIVLEIKMNENTTPHILAFLDLFCKYKHQHGTNERDYTVVEEESSYSTTFNSSADSFENENTYSSDDDDSFFDVNEENTGDTIIRSQLFDEDINFISVIDRWTDEYRTYMKDLNEYYIVRQPNSYKIKNNYNSMIINSEIIAQPSIPNSQTMGSFSATTSIQTPTVSVINQGLIPEQEICTYQADCQCLDCLDNESSDSSIGCFDGEFPNLDTNVLNDLPDDILFEVVQSHYDTKRSESTQYTPINTQFLLSLNDRVRNVFEEFELRYREDYRPQSDSNQDLVDLGAIEIRDKQPLIDVKYLDHVLNLIFSNVSDKSAINFIHAVCSNNNLRSLFVTKVIDKLRNSSLVLRSTNDKKNDILNNKDLVKYGNINESRISAKLQILNSDTKYSEAFKTFETALKLIYSLIRQQEDYFTHFSLYDINLFYDVVDLLSYDQHYTLYDELNTIMCDYELLKKIFTNTEGLNLEFTDNFTLISKEFGILEEGETYYLPHSLTLFNHKEHGALLNIVDTNVGHILRLYINRNKWFEIIRSSFGHELLDHFDGIIREDFYYFPMEYIVFLFGELIRMIYEVDFQRDFYEELNKIFFYFSALSKSRVNIADQGSPKVKSISVEKNKVYDTTLRSLYFKECRDVYDSLRIQLEQCPIWDNFFNFIGKNRDKGFIMSYVQVFECFCMLRRLRFDENEFTRISLSDDCNSAINILTTENMQKLTGNGLIRADGEIPADKTSANKEIYNEVTAGTYDISHNKNEMQKFEEIDGKTNERINNNVINEKTIIENAILKSTETVLAKLNAESAEMQDTLNTDDTLGTNKRLKTDSESENNKLYDLKHLNNDITTNIPENVTPFENKTEKNINVDFRKKEKQRNFNNFFIQKVHEYKDVLNHLFDTGGNHNNSMEVLLYCNILSFENRRKYIKSIFSKRSTITTLCLNVERNKVFQDSFMQIMSKKAEDFVNMKLNVKFANEEGVDVGGLTREFYTVICKEFVNPNYCLFTLNQDKRSYSFNKSSYVNTEHLLFYRFVGRIIAKGIVDNVHTDLHFTTAYYKQILDLSLTFADLETIEPDFYNSYLWMKENSITGIIDLKFCADFNEFGQIVIEDLIENGRNIQVDNSNKELYIKLMSHFLMTKGCEKQMNSFKEGFYEIIRKDYIKIFNEKELELLICGLPEIDVDDWKNNTDYCGYKVNSKQIEWFWRCVRGMTNEDKAKLLQFVTGTSKLPIEGFKVLQGSDGKQRFQIQKGGSGLPCAHTCFNQLDLPPYQSYEELSNNLLYAIRECNTGFGFA